MSSEATFWAWVMGVKPATSKLVLLCLADCHNADNGRCDPSVRFIAEFTGLNRKTVTESLQLLEHMGLIQSSSRGGTSNQYTLLIDANPAPPREPGKRREVVQMQKVAKSDLAQKRDTPKTGYPKNGVAQNRDNPISGQPKNGTGGWPKNGLGGWPEIGVGGGPKLGHEPTSNLQGEPTSKPTSSEPNGSAAVAGKPVDNSSLTRLAEFYDSPDNDFESSRKSLFTIGAEYLVRAGVGAAQARSFLGKCLQQHGEGPVLDAILEALSRGVDDPRAYIRRILELPRRPMAKDWEPGPEAVVRLQGLGMPYPLLRDSAAFFRLWILEREVHSADFDAWFCAWAETDWNSAAANPQLLRGWYGDAAKNVFRENP